MTIGNRLKEERERLNLSQTSLAEAAGTTKKTQIDYETDRTPPKANYLAVVASWGVDVAYVITGERVENTATTPDELAFLRLARAMPNKEVAAAARQALVGILASHGVKLN